MSSELTEKKRPNISHCKGIKQSKMIVEPTEDLRTPYTGDMQAVLTGVEGKNLIPTSTLLNTFIKNIKAGRHTVESKAESDKELLDILCIGKTIKNRGLIRQDCADYIHEYNEPIVNNYYYTFINSTYDPVRFKVTKINKTYGFTRQDTGECCNFTIVSNKRGGYTYKLQPLNYFNLPEWQGG